MQIVYAGCDVRVVAVDGLDFQATESLKDGGERAVRHLKGLEDAADGAVAVKVALRRFFYGDVYLRDGANEEVVLLGVLDEPDGLVAAYRYGKDRAREDGGVAECQNRQNVRKVGLAELGYLVSLYKGDDVDILFHKKSVKMSVKGA